MTQQTRARQADVARLARVSPAIVSLVVNNRLDGKVQISEETRQRVGEAIRTLGYVPNPVARKLAGGQNRLLGVYSAEPVFPLRQEHFYPHLVGIEEEAAAQDYDLILFTRPSGPGGQRAIYRDGVNTLQLADGAIFVDPTSRHDEMIRLVQEGFPFVLVGRRDIVGAEVSYVAADYASAVDTVVTQLMTLGHRRIAYLGPSEQAEWNEDRERGYHRAHQRQGLVPDGRLIVLSRVAALTPDVVTHLFTLRATAVVVDGTDLAATFLSVAHGQGKRAPDDFSLADLDDATSFSPDAEAIEQALEPHQPRRRPLALMDPGGSSGADPAPLLGMTTILIPRHRMGVEAVRLLIEILAHRQEAAPQRVTLPCTIVPGRTVGPAPSGSLKSERRT